MKSNKQSKYKIQRRLSNGVDNSWGDLKYQNNGVGKEIVDSYSSKKEAAEELKEIAKAFGIAKKCFRVVAFSQKEE